MTLKVYISGTFVDKDAAKVSVFDHGFLFGDGIFEGMRSYSGRVFRHREHLERLWESARSVAIEIPISRDEMETAVNKTLQVNDITDGYIRLIVTRGIGTLGLDAHLCQNPQIVIIADHLKLYPQEFYDCGLEIVTASTVRTSAAAVSPQIKSLNYLNNILAKIEGHRAGCAEALMLNAQGEVAECTGDNIFIVKRGRMRTPHTAAGILEGITRRVVMELAAASGMAVEEVAMTRHDVYTADEVFLTGSGAELIPVVRIDARDIGNGKPGPVFRKLLALFREETLRKETLRW